MTENKLTIFVFCPILQCRYNILKKKLVAHILDVKIYEINHQHNKHTQREIQLNGNGFDIQSTSQQKLFNRPNLTQIPALKKIINFPNESLFPFPFL